MNHRLTAFVLVMLANVGVSRAIQPIRTIDVTTQVSSDQQCVATKSITKVATFFGVIPSAIPTPPAAVIWGKHELVLIHEAKANLRLGVAYVSSGTAFFEYSASSTASDSTNTLIVVLEEGTLPVQDGKPQVKCVKIIPERAALHDRDEFKGERKADTQMDSHRDRPPRE
jgi:hypothetical protein